MEQEPSPVTGIIDESEVFVDFGKYEGKTVREVAEIDPEWYAALITEKSTGVYAIKRTKDKRFRLYLNPLGTNTNQ